MRDIFGGLPNQEALKNKPPDLKAEAVVFDVCFHPANDLLAIASIDGDAIV